MKMYFILVVLVLMFIHSMGWAQQEASYTLYRYHLNLINPATSGELMADLLDTDLKETEAETTLELNFAVLKLKHTTKRKK